MAAPEQHRSGSAGQGGRTPGAGDGAGRGSDLPPLADAPWGSGADQPSDEEISGVFRAYAARELRSRLEPEATQETELRGLIRRYVAERRSRGEAPERVLVSLKRLLVGAYERLATERKLDRAFSRYLAYVVRWTVEDHVAGWVARDYFDRPDDAPRRRSRPE